MITIDILGSTWSISEVKFHDDPYCEANNVDGYCNYATKHIVCVKQRSVPGKEELADEEVVYLTKRTLRHEIVHAFLHESGLNSDASQTTGSWAENEEMVDWFALQGPKIYVAWRQASAL